MGLDEEPGQHAAPARASRVSLRAVLQRVGARIVAGPVLDRAAQLAFYAVLALAPFLVVLTSLAGFLPSADAVTWLLGRAEELLPTDAFRLVSQVVKDVVHSRSATLFTLGLATALWSASRAANVLRDALNSAHDLVEGRSWLRRQALALALTLGGAGLLLASVVASMGGAGLVERLAAAAGVEAGREARLWGLLHWPVAIAGVAVLAALAYRLLPDTRPRARPVWSGALVASALFLASSRLFSWFVAHVVDYGPTYGTLAGFVVLLLWAWLTSIAFIVGGEVTAALPGTRPRRATRERSVQGLPGAAHLQS